MDVTKPSIGPIREMMGRETRRGCAHCTACTALTTRDRKPPSALASHPLQLCSIWTNPCRLCLYSILYNLHQEEELSSIDSHLSRCHYYFIPLASLCPWLHRSNRFRLIPRRFPCLPTLGYPCCCGQAPKMPDRMDGPPFTFTNTKASLHPRQTPLTDPEAVNAKVQGLLR